MILLTLIFMSIHVPIWSLTKTINAHTCCVHDLLKIVFFIQSKKKVLMRKMHDNELGNNAYWITNLKWWYNFINWIFIYIWMVLQRWKRELCIYCTCMHARLNISKILTRKMYTSPFFHFNHLYILCKRKMNMLNFHLMFIINPKI